jgi:hypothetical protein
MSCDSSLHPVLKRRAPVGLVVALLLGGALPLTAEEAQPEVALEYQIRFTAGSHLADGTDRVTQTSNLVDLFVPVAGSSAFGLGVDLVAERLNFRFQNFDGFLAGRAAPVAAASVVTLQPTLVLMPAQPWSLVGSATLQYSAAESATFSKAILVSGAVASTWQYARNVKVGLGLNVSQRMNDSPSVVPFPVIDWRISDRWQLTALDGESGRLSGTITRSWRVFGQLEFQWRDIRLGRSSSIPSGILRYEAFPLFAGLEFKPTRHFAAEVFAGTTLAQRYRLADERGALLGASRHHTPMLVGLDLTCTF